MSKPQVEFHPEAVAEARAAREFYDIRSRLASAAFVTELDHAIEQIREAPSRWPQYLEDTRRYLRKRFPFIGVYPQRSNMLQILAVAHGKRRPGYWKIRSG